MTMRSQTKLRKKRKSGEALVVQQDMEAWPCPCLLDFLSNGLIWHIRISFFQLVRCWPTRSGELRATGECHLAARWGKGMGFKGRLLTLRCKMISKDAFRLVMYLREWRMSLDLPVNLCIRNGKQISTMINWIQLGLELVAENDDFCSPFALWYLLKGATVVPEPHYQRPSAKVYDFCVLEQLQTLHSQPSPRNSRGSRVVLVRVQLCGRSV